MRQSNEGNSGFPFLGINGYSCEYYPLFTEKSVGEKTFANDTIRTEIEAL
jgi:hypothetical protein